MADHHAGVWRFLRRLGLSREDADDILQEVVLVIARKLDSVAQGKEPAFFYGTALRVAHGAWRRRARQVEVVVDTIPEVDSGEPPADALVEQREKRRLLDELLALMPEDLRMVFVLYEIEGLTMAEISEVLNIRPGTTASRLRRARAEFEQRVARVEAREQRRGGRS